MGYLTYFHLRMEGSEEAIEKAKSDLLAIDDDFDILWEEGETFKWYDWEKDMTLIASRNPEVLFILDGDGEETDDLWQWRGKGKETEYHTWCIPPFENKNLFTEYEKQNNN